MVAARVANIPHGGDRSKVAVATLKSQSEVAEEYEISRDTVLRSKAVHDKGTDALISAVDYSEITGCTAKAIGILKRTAECVGG